MARRSECDRTHKAAGSEPGFCDAAQIPGRENGLPEGGFQDVLSSSGGTCNVSRNSITTVIFNVVDLLRR